MKRKRQEEITAIAIGSLVIGVSFFCIGLLLLWLLPVAVVFLLVGAGVITFKCYKASIDKLNKDEDKQ